MRTLEQLINHNKTIRTIGIDDAPFRHKQGEKVNISGIICSNTRFEGMIWSKATVDGTDATETIIDLIKQSKFHDQIHLILFDGIAIGGFNIIDIERVCDELERPCIAVMRKQPNLKSIDDALRNFDDYEQRRHLLDKAGQIHNINRWFFQVKGCNPEIAASALEKLTDNGHVPEALRLAHLIGAAVMNGQSSNRA